MSNFLFPIETTARELDHKILMAVMAANSGRKIFVGDQQIIRTLSFILKGGVFYGKHLFGKPKFSDKKYYKRLKYRNFKIVHLNEEGAVWPGGEPEWKSILKQCERPSQLTEDDYLATWGNWQKEFNESYEPTSAKIVITGHPRFDLYSKKYLDYFSNETNKLKEEYGDFILVNTAFSYSNNGEGGAKFIFKPNIAYDVNNDAHRKYRFKRWKQQMFSLADIVDLVNNIALKYPDKKIILRPHPSEDTQYYRDIFQNIRNVKVIYQGAVTPWILACKILIHNGCTTAIEATLAKKPVINYSTNSDPSFDVYLANICGSKMGTVDDVLFYLSRVYNEEVNISMPVDEKANDLFYNFQSNNTALKVLDLLNLAAKKVNENKINSLSTFQFNLLTFSHKYYLFFKYSYLSFKGRRKDRVDYRKRFELFSHNDIQERVERMAVILGKEVKVTLINKYLFVVEGR
jgi:surface carbohydrate biosynthesis protein